MPNYLPGIPSLINHKLFWSRADKLQHNNSLNLKRGKPSGCPDSCLVLKIIHPLLWHIGSAVNHIAIFKTFNKILRLLAYTIANPTCESYHNSKVLIGMEIKKLETLRNHLSNNSVFTY